jgi:hypothetical protein
VAENDRFLESYQYASQEILKVGRILGFRVVHSTFVKVDDEYYSIFHARGTFT